MVAVMGFMDKTDSIPARGARVAQYVESYLNAHQGLAIGELSFRLRVDKRDLHRLLNERSCGARLEDALAAYFGPDFIESVFAHVYEAQQSIRQRELASELEAIEARSADLERLRRARRSAWAVDHDQLGGGHG